MIKNLYSLSGSIQCPFCGIVHPAADATYYPAQTAKSKWGGARKRKASEFSAAELMLDPELGMEEDEEQRSQNNAFQ